MQLSGGFNFRMPWSSIHLNQQSASQPNTLLSKALLAYKQGIHGRAEELFRLILKKDSNQALPNFMLGRLSRAHARK